MKTLSFDYDENCGNCLIAFNAIKEAWKPNNKTYYGTKSKKNCKNILGLTLRPDYNGHGQLTHYHLETTER